MKRNQVIAFIATSMMALSFSMPANALSTIGTVPVLGIQQRQRQGC